MREPKELTLSCESAGGKPRPRVLARAGSDQPDVDIRDSLSRSPPPPFPSYLPTSVPLIGFVLPRITMLISPPRGSRCSEGEGCEMHLSIKRHLDRHCREKKIKSSWAD